MKILVDTANVETIKKFNALKMIDGVTTNPSSISKETDKPESIITQILNIINGEVSVEVLSIKADDMISEGIKFSKLDDKIIVKIPVTSEGLLAIRELTKIGIKTNATLIFDESTALLAAKAGATYVSVFVGRLYDNNIDGTLVLKNIKNMLTNYGFCTKVIAASIRNIKQVNDVINTGCDLVTIPSHILEEMAKHPLTMQGVQKEESDYN